MIPFPAIDPVAFKLGPVAVHWYGIAYIVGIGLGWWVLQRRAAGDGSQWGREDVADVVFFAAVGGVLGGRIGYALFYNFADYIDSPLSIFAVWRGGMAFHGGAIGFVLALAFFARRRGRRFLSVSDFVVPVVPIGLFFGRIANFVNQELWGAPTSLPWGVVFTHPASGGIARHPSQLYEALLEGVVLFLLLRFVASRNWAVGAVSAAFLIAYGMMRVGIEFVRQPDQHIGYLAWGWVTMGQVLSLPMVLFGLMILVFARERQN
ncbi:MAG: prolipoprotein diacylglyceryl transferase [Gammaproteobacteria bacterium]|jgi:phosphatidylglycerol:prolipoprotein diacylglycerol transferase|nr:prolipoprotein diacylglyceryl transferase [Gammaproteobacteria bacterium]